MHVAGSIVFLLVGTGFLGFALLFRWLTNRDRALRVPSRLLVTKVEEIRNREGDKMHQPHYLVLEGPLAGKHVVSAMSSSAPMHEKNDYVDGFVGSHDGKAVSTIEAVWERRAPYFLLAVSLACYIASVALYIFGT